MQIACKHPPFLPLVVHLTPFKLAYFSFCTLHEPSKALEQCLSNRRTWQCTNVTFCTNSKKRVESWIFGRRSHLRLPRVSNHLPLLRLQKPQHDENKLEPIANLPRPGVGTRDIKNEQPCPFLRLKQSLMNINSHCRLGGSGGLPPVRA